MLKKRVAVYTSLGALLLALSFMGYSEIVINEGGGMGDIIGYGNGYWLWLVSIGSIMVAIILSRLNGIAAK